VINLEMLIPRIPARVEQRYFIGGCPVFRGHVIGLEEVAPAARKSKVGVIV
jgi:hypothetical protein